MFIEQLSVFLENRLGRFTQIAKLFGENGINMKAFTVSENAEFGVLHLHIKYAIDKLPNSKKNCSINLYTSCLIGKVCLIL